MQLLTYLIMLPFVTLVALLWVPLGFVISIALIVLSFVTFTFELLVAAISQRHSRNTGAALRRAIAFWPKGFAIIFGSLTGAADENDEEQTDSKTVWNVLETIFQTLLATVIFWSATFFVLDQLKILDVRKIAFPPVEVTVCNRSLSKAFVAARFLPDHERPWIAAGWYGIESGKCGKIFTTPNRVFALYADKEDSDSYWGGDSKICVMSKKFESSEVCSMPDHRIVKARAIKVDAFEDSYTWTLIDK